MYLLVGLMVGINMTLAWKACSAAVGALRAYWNGYDRVYRVLVSHLGVTKDITAQVLALPDAVPSLQPARGFFDSLHLPNAAQVEVQGYTPEGQEYRFVFFSDSTLFLPLNLNYRPRGLGAERDVIEARGVFGAKDSDLTDFVRRWTACDVEVQDVLPYAVRDFQAESELPFPENATLRVRVTFADGGGCTHYVRTPSERFKHQLEC